MKDFFTCTAVDTDSLECSDTVSALQTAHFFCRCQWPLSRNHCIADSYKQRADDNTQHGPKTRL